MNLASYSTVGADVAAPGGDYSSASGTVMDAVLAALPSDSAIAEELRLIERDLGIDLLVEQGGATYAYLNGTSMAAPHAAGIAALIIEQHPKWSPIAVAAAVKRTARPLPCPANWQPLFDGDERTKCRGGRGHTSFFGAGLVDAATAARS
jgi:subtilisin family serine protease